MLTPADIARGHVDSVGRPHPGVEISVLDEEARQVARDGPARSTYAART